jgi:Tfp pilus assembly protein PilN
MMNSVILHDVRAGFFLMMGLLMLAMICAVAALGTVMRPVRWADRRSAQF